MNEYTPKGPTQNKLPKRTANQDDATSGKTINVRKKCTTMQHNKKYSKPE